jgi:hypothetical protein
MILTIINAAQKAKDLERSWDRLASLYADLHPNYVHEFLEAMDRMDRYRTLREKFERGYTARVQALERDVS